MPQAIAQRRKSQEQKPKRAKPMPRAKRREQLLDVARRIIQRGGIGSLTMSALAEESGAAKPVVYEHFENAESVAVALLETYFETMIELVASRTSEAESLDEYLSIAIDTQFEFHRKDRLVVRGITNGHSSGDRLNATYLKVRENSLETLQELVRQQGASAEDAAAAGFVLWELIASSVFEFAMKPNAGKYRDAVKRMALGAVHAIVPETGRKPVTPEKILATARAFKQSRGA